MSTPLGPLTAGDRMSQKKKNLHLWPSDIDAIKYVYGLIKKRRFRSSVLIFKVRLVLQIDNDLVHKRVQGRAIPSRGFIQQRRSLSSKSVCLSHIPGCLSM